MKKALVTGASSGIGYAIAKSLARSGFVVDGVGRDIEKLEEAFQKLDGRGHGCFCADLTTKEGVAKAKSLLEKDYDVLVNNAGCGLYGDFVSYEVSEFLKIIDLNIKALVELSHQYLLTAKKGDALINVASVLAFTSFAESSVYAGTKAFVVNFSQGLWATYRSKGILVQAFCPGATHSNFHASAGGDDRKMPQILFASPDGVAKDFMEGLRGRKGPILVSGNLNKVFVIMSRILGPKIMAFFQGFPKIPKLKKKL